MGFDIGSVVGAASSLLGGGSSGGSAPAAPAGPSAAGGRGGDVFNAGSLFGSVINNAKSDGGAGGSAATGNAGNGAQQSQGVSSWVWLALGGVVIAGVLVFAFKKLK